MNFQIWHRKVHFFFLSNQSKLSFDSESTSLQSVMAHQQTADRMAATEKLCLLLHSYFREPVHVPPEFDTLILKDEFVLELLLSVQTGVQATQMMLGKSCKMNYE